MEHLTIQGTHVPALGLGTWQLRGQACTRAVTEALELGYRHIDTAQMYGNEAEIGAAIRQSGVDEDELFVVTKIGNDNHAADRVRSSTEASVQAFGLEAIDLLLIHHPVDWDRVGETLEAMSQLRERGLVRHLGVSNFSVAQMDDALGRAPLIANQVQHHVSCRQDDVLRRVQETDMTLTAWSPVGHGKHVDDQVLSEIGERHGKTAAQVALRWLLDQPNVSTVPKSSSRDHLAENLDVFDFSLDDDDRRRIDDLDRSEPALS